MKYPKTFTEHFVGIDWRLDGIMEWSVCCHILASNHADYNKGQPQKGNS